MRTRPCVGSFEPLAINTRRYPTILCLRYAIKALKQHSWEELPGAITVGVLEYSHLWVIPIRRYPISESVYRRLSYPGDEAANLVAEARLRTALKSNVSNKRSVHVTNWSGRHGL